MSSIETDTKDIWKWVALPLGPIAILSWNSFSVTTIDRGLLWIIFILFMIPVLYFILYCYFIVNLTFFQTSAVKKLGVDLIKPYLHESFSNQKFCEKETNIIAESIAFDCISENIMSKRRRE